MHRPLHPFSRSALSLISAQGRYQPRLRLSSIHSGQLSGRKYEGRAVASAATTSSSAAYCVIGRVRPEMLSPRAKSPTRRMSPLAMANATAAEAGPASIADAVAFSTPVAGS